MCRREQGFSAIEIILVVAVIGLLVAVGYLFVQSANKQDTNKTAESSQTKKSESPKAESQPAESTVALDHVKAFYKKFLSEPDYIDTYPPSKWVNEGYVTQAAADQYSNHPYSYDLVTCSQGPLEYKDYNFSVSTISSTTGMVHITGKYESGTSVMIMVDITKDAGTWKINKFNCSM